VALSLALNGLVFEIAAIALPRIRAVPVQNPPIPVTLIVEQEDAPSEIAAPASPAPSMAPVRSATRPRSRHQVSLLTTPAPNASALPAIARDPALSADTGGIPDVAAPVSGMASAGAALRVFGEGEVDSAARPALPIRPRYPEHARLLGLESDVKLMVTVEPDGHVSHVELLSSGGEEFDREAQEALQRARFVAARKSGEPVAEIVSFTVRFRLDE
jgi:periplasmic protein TonB